MKCSFLLRTLWRTLVDLVYNIDLWLSRENNQITQNILWCELNHRYIKVLSDKNVYRNMRQIEYNKLNYSALKCIYQCFIKKVEKAHAICNLVKSYLKSNLTSGIFFLIFAKSEIHFFFYIFHMYFHMLNNTPAGGFVSFEHVCESMQIVISLSIGSPPFHIALYI